MIKIFQGYWLAISKGGAKTAVMETQRPAPARPVPAGISASVYFRFNINNSIRIMGNDNKAREALALYIA